jgi:hypothetical protein
MSSIEGVTKTIDLIIAPVVLITACVLTINGLIVRYNSLADYIRTLNREVSGLRNTNTEQNQAKEQRLQELEYLLSDLLHHHHFVHDAALMVYLSILIFMLDMLVIAIAVATNINWLSQMALIVFLSGVAILFIGMLLIANELLTSHHSIQLEVQHNCRLCRGRNTAARFHLLRR